MKLRIKAFIDSVSNEIIANSKNTKRTDNSELNMNEMENENTTTPEILQEVNLEKIKSEIEDKYFKIQVLNEEEVPYDKLDINSYFTLKEKYFWIGDILTQMISNEFAEYLYSNMKSSTNNAYNNFAITSANNINNLNIMNSNYQNLNFAYCSYNMNYEINNFLNEKFDNLSKELQLIEEEISRRKFFIENENKNKENEVKETKDPKKGAKKDNKKGDKTENTDNSGLEKNIELINNILSEETLNYMINNKKTSFILENKHMFSSEMFFSNQGMINYYNKFNMTMPGNQNVNENQLMNVETNKYNANFKNKEKMTKFILNIFFDPSNKLEKITQILQKAALSSIYLIESKSYKSLDNLIYTVNNFIKFDMLSPFEASRNEIWSYLLIIISNGLKRLKISKNGYGEVDKFDDVNDHRELINQRLSNKDELSDVINPNIPKNLNYGECPKHNNPSIQKNIKVDEEFEIDYLKQNVNLDAYIELAFFEIQTLFYLKKYNLNSNLIIDLNQSTNNKYAEFSLPFLIDSQKNLHLLSKEHSDNKKLQINNRVKEFELWNGIKIPRKSGLHRTPQ